MLHYAVMQREEARFSGRGEEEPLERHQMLIKRTREQPPADSRQHGPRPVVEADVEQVGSNRGKRLVAVPVDNPFSPRATRRDL